MSLAKDPTKSTKVLFLRGYTGICIRWYTGMITKFEFALVEWIIKKNNYTYIYFYIIIIIIINIYYVVKLLNKSYVKSKSNDVIY